jgi:signal transduction histidine kinase
MALVLVGIFATSAERAFERRQVAEHVLSITGISRDMFMAMQTIRIERGTVNTALETQTVIGAGTRGEIAALRSLSEAALASAFRKLGNDQRAGLDTIRINHNDFLRARSEVDAALQLPKEQRRDDLSGQWIGSVGKLVTSINALSDKLANEIVMSDSFITEMMKIKQLGWIVRDAAGSDRLLVGAAIANGKTLTPGQQLRLATLNGRIETAWKMIEDDTRALGLPTPLMEAVAEANKFYFGVLRTKRRTILDDLTADWPATATATGREWIAASNPALESLMNVANTAFDLSEDHAAAEAAAAARSLYIATFLTLLFFGLGIYTTLFVSRRVARPMAKITEAMRAVAHGNLGGEIPYARRADEVGELARALDVFRDNARQKQRMEEELLRKERLSALGQLTATVAHELRNPLSAIRNTIFMMKDAASGSGLNFNRPIERIERSISRCDRIIGELLEYTRIRELKLSPVVFDKWIDDVLNEQKFAAGITVTRRLGAPGQVVNFDLDRMRQIVINLAENAAQAMLGMDSSATERRLTISTALIGSTFEFTIADTGPGIPAEILPKVFEPLFSTKSFGTGLGLPMVRQIAEQHGGKVEISSTIGRGTAVHVSLPMRLAQDLAA